MRWFFLIFLSLTYSLSMAGLPGAFVIIHGKGTRGPYSLGHRNIQSNSVEIRKGDVILRPDDYSVQYIEGLVSFEQAVPVGDSLTARFAYIPISLKSQYYLHYPVEAKMEKSKSLAPAESRAGEFSPDLEIRGSKGFSIEAGQGAGGLSQSLNLTINGDIVSGLRTSAHISDKGTGTGAARRIEEIDKLFIQAESDNFIGTFGDFEYDRHSRGFMNFRRKLTGLDANYRKGGLSIKGAAAFFPGEYESMTITGIDGRLGPYYLLDVGGREGAAILSGSERVYIDGVLQKRGSEYDYTIDYEAGAIEFAPSKVISSQTRITIDYEVARQEYSRSFYAGGGSANLSSRVSVFGNLMQEGDRSGSPRSFEMTDENRVILENAGADRLSASRDGAVFVGTGNGDYLLRNDSLGNQYYFYAGPGLGEYNVTFSFIGKNEGSYRPRGGGIYDYIGSGFADYEPVILLPLPQTRRYGSVGASAATADSSAFIETELAGSYYDRNAISVDDKSLQGFSGDMTAGLRRHLFDDGYIGIAAKTRNIGADAIFPGRIDAVERYREYDLDPNSSSDGENLKEASIDGVYDRYRRIRLETGYLTRPQIEDRWRNAGEASWRLPGAIDWFGRLERTRGNRVWWKRSSGLSASWRAIQPSFRMDFESRDGEAGFKYYEYKTSLPAQYAGGVSGVTQLTYRDEKYQENGWKNKFRSGAVQQKVEFVSSRSGLSGELTGSYFKKKYLDFSGTDSDQKTGSVRLSFTDPGGRGEVYLNERLTSSNERLRSKSYVFVGQGEGEYRYEDGEYILDPDGDYIQVIEELGEGIKISEISTEIDLSSTPSKILSRGGGFESDVGRLVVESELAYRLRKSSDILTGRDFYPWIRGGGENILFNRGALDIRFFYYPAGTKHRLKYSLSRSFQDGKPFANETVSERFRSDEISWAFPAGRKFDLLVTGTTSNKKSETNGLGYSVNRIGESVKIDNKLTDTWTLQVGQGFEVAKQTDIDLRARIPSAGIGLIKEIKNRGRLSVNISYSRLIVDPGGSYVPYQVATGKREGDNMTALAKARLELYRNGRLDFLYRFEKFAQRPERHNLKMEFTILFQ